MNIAIINACDYGSTGKIMFQTAECARKRGHTVYTFSRGWCDNTKPLPYHQYFGTFLENAIHYKLSSYLGFNECYSFFGTTSLIRKLKKIKPDIIHLHNLHGWYLNLPLLFRYIKKNNIRLLWTLHDCWTFTGHCPHFDMIGCDKWKTGCYDCPQYKCYPQSHIDNSKQMYALKKRWFTGVDDLTIITPSQWLADLVQQSFLKAYPIKVIHNGIDLTVFTPRNSDFRNKYNLENKFVLLGVAFDWGERKGLDVFIELAKQLDDRFQIVLVGTNDQMDQQLPKNIISIHKTQDQYELAKIYTAADIFINPTREEVLGLVNLESLACGTPVLTFNTGGSPETIDGTCGTVVPKNDMGALFSEIIRICTEAPYTKQACLKKVKEFNMNDRFKEYVDLYER